MKSYKTIKELVIDAYKSEGGMPPPEKLAALVLQHFPNSKWKDTHYAWYKSKLKTKKFVVSNGSGAPEPEPEQIESEVEEAIEARVSIERDLHDFLAKHLTQLEPGLSLHKNGVEYNTAAGRIDILALDGKKQVVVIEIKAGTAKDGALGQLLGYMGCLTNEYPTARGILVASAFDERVVYAAKAAPRIRLIKYRLNFGFEAIS